MSDIYIRKYAYIYENIHKFNNLENYAVKGIKLLCHKGQSHRLQ